MISDFFTGPEPCNTGPLISKRETGGLDFLIFQVFGAHTSFASLSAKLEEKKESAKGGGKSRLRLGESIAVEIAAHGSGRFDNACKWQFSRSGILFALADRASSGPDGKPVGRVEIPSGPLMSCGLRSAFELVEETLSALGICYSGSKVLRVDVCADVAGVPIGEFVRKFTAGDVVRQTGKFSLWGDGHAKDGIQTLVIGGAGAAVQCRIYDKVAEVKRDEAKRQVFERLRLDFSTQCCTRVEFQLRRQCLRDQFGVDSVEESLRKLGAIVDELTTQWLRFMGPGVDRRNTTRSKEWPIWLRVKDDFRNWLGQMKFQEVRKREPVELDRKKKSAIVNGYINSILAKSWSGVIPIGDAVDDVLGHIAMVQGKKERLERVEKKRRLNEQAAFDDVAGFLDGLNKRPAGTLFDVPSNSQAENSS